MLAIVVQPLLSLRLNHGQANAFKMPSIGKADVVKPF
jgi:hypothetical protein